VNEQPVQVLKQLLGRVHAL